MWSESSPAIGRSRDERSVRDACRRDPLQPSRPGPGTGRRAPAGPSNANLRHRRWSATQSHPSDADACISARAALAEIDWPCAITREFSEANLGCDRRIMSGLDWTFAQTDRAVVLEDDILPHPSFLPWAARVLERFHDDDEVAMVSGHNLLGHWGDATMDHVRSPARQRLGLGNYSVRLAANQCGRSLWRSGGRASGRRATRTRSDRGRAPCDCAGGYRHGTLRAWDVIWLLRMALRRGAAIVSSINLVQNTGIGRTPREPRMRRTSARSSRWVKRDCLARDGRRRRFGFRPCGASRPIARALRRSGDGVAAGATDQSRREAFRSTASARLYLAPFAVPGESLAVLEHLARQDADVAGVRQVARHDAGDHAASAVLS